MRTKAKRDANEPTIIEALQRCGAHVRRLNDAGLPDLIVLWRHRVFLLEIKTAKGCTTPAQDELIAQGWPVTLVRDSDEALHAIGAVLHELG